LIGIDYGEKRVGVSVSDASGSIAFPKATFPNDRTLIPIIVNLIRKENVSTVVVGESRDARGSENPIATAAKRFVMDLQKAVAVTVLYEPEFYTSLEARKTSGKRAVDAEAAAIILNSYLTRLRQGFGGQARAKESGSSP
jgi:putative Holliday junction resolvase